MPTSPYLSAPEQLELFPDSEPASAPPSPLGRLLSRASADSKTRPAPSPREQFKQIRERMRALVTGHLDVVDRLALLGLQHLRRQPGVRAVLLRGVLIGPSGTGKTTLVRALATSLDIPLLELDAGLLAEQNWRGQGISDHLSKLTVPHRGMPYPCVFLDELDKVALPGVSEGGVTREYLVGKQRTLLSFWGGADVHLEPGAGGTVFPSSRALVIGAGVFTGLPTQRDPDASDLIRYGMLPELVERLGTILRVRPLAVTGLAAMLRDSLASTHVLYEQFGYRLVVPETTLTFVAQLIRGSRGGTGPRTGQALLRSAAQDALLALLNGPSRRKRHVLTPDDVRIPAHSRASDADDEPPADSRLSFR